MLVKDISAGMKFNKLTVVKFHGYTTDSMRLFECKCDCGNTVVVRGISLISNHTKSCGRCLEREMIGRRFGSLVVVSVSHRNPDRRNALYFKCKCDCGGDAIVSSFNLRQGKTKSCGHCVDNYCVGKKFNHLTILSNIDGGKKVKYVKVKCDCGNEKIMIRHSILKGRFHTCGDCYKALEHSYKPEIKRRCSYLSYIYDAIKDRCDHPNNPIYYLYGGRGIKCDFDRMSFVKKYYLDTDIDIENLQVDRIDNDKGYSFDNIRWVPFAVNVNNRLYNTPMTYIDVAKRLMSINSFRRVKLVNDESIDENDFNRIRFPLYTKAGEELALFIHKSIYNDKDKYIKRIVDFYKKDGFDINIDDISDKVVDKAVIVMIEFYRRNHLEYDRSLIRFNRSFENIRFKYPEFDNISVIDIYDKFIKNLFKN